MKLFAVNGKLELGTLGNTYWLPAGQRSVRAPRLSVGWFCAFSWSWVEQSGRTFLKTV